MQEARNFLRTEGERIERETARYTKLARTASASVEIIFDIVRGWREAGHPVDEGERIRDHSPSPEDSIGPMPECS